MFCVKDLKTVGSKGEKGKGDREFFRGKRGTDGARKAHSGIKKTKSPERLILKRD